MYNIFAILADGETLKSYAAEPYRLGRYLYSICSAEIVTVKISQDHPRELRHTF